MASTTTQRRKGGAPKSLEGIQQVEQEQPMRPAVPMMEPFQEVPMAQVRRRRCGTGPFDQNWLNLDCCGLFCAAITYCLHAYGVFAVCVVLLPPWMSTTDDQGVRTLTWMGQFHRFAFTLIALLAVAAHFKAMTTDPGAVPPDSSPLEEQKSTSDLEHGNDTVEDDVTPLKKGLRLCRRCKAFKPKRAHHCSVCRRCIIKMDHHCPWVNNCVGIGNHKYFLLFIFYTFLLCLYSFSLVVIRFFTCMGNHGHIRSHHLTCLDKPTQLINILCLIVEAILFGLFTSCMMIDQAGVVTSKMTHIDRLKGGEDETGNSLAGVIEVFGLSNRGFPTSTEGSRFRPDWLSPFAKVCFPQSIQDEIMGFCRPCLSGVGMKSQETTELTALSFRPGTSQLVRSVADIV